MGNLQDDKDVKATRDKKLKDVDAELRFQIPAKLLVKVKELELGNKARQLWSSGNSERQEWLNRQKKYLRNWDEFLESTSQGPFESSSSLHIPMPFIVIKTYHARMTQALLGDDFMFTAKARRSDSVEREQIVSQVMRYALKDWANQNEGVEEVVDDWVWQWCATGVGLLKWRWETQYTRFVDIETELEAKADFQVGEDNEERFVPKVEQVEKEVERTKQIFNGPVLETINVEDYLILGGKGNPQKADVNIHRIHLTADDLYSKADQKIFDLDAVKKIIEGGADHRSDDSDLKEDRSQIAGMAQADTHNDLDTYEILETYWNIDIDGSGLNSKIVTWTHQRSGEELRATYLYRVSPDGRVPFFKADFFRRKDQSYGMGLAEVLHPLSKELDFIRNSRIDYGTLSTMPFGFIRSTSSMDEKKIKIAPGTLIAVDNPQTDVFFPNLGSRTTFGLQEESLINTMVERLTGISDLSLGVLSSSQGAARTAFGARALVGQAASNLDVHLKRLVRAWKSALDYLFHTLQKRIPPGLSFRVTGDTASAYWATVRDKEDLAGDFDFEISSQSLSSDPGIRQQVAQQILALTSNPLTLQLGIVTPRNMYEAVKNVMKSLQVRDFSKYFTEPSLIPIILTPEEEFNRVIRGIDTPVLPQSNHEGYITYFNTIFKNDEIIGTLSEEQTIAASQQAQIHTQMLEALNQAAAQQRNTQQIQTNQQQGARNNEPQ